MGLILNIETSTKSCSISIYNNGDFLACKEETKEEFIHSKKLILFIVDIIKDANININDLDAVAISKGPGSYTGLRIGTSTAKGLCYAMDIPLISVSTLKAMAYGIAKKYNYNLFCPMIDARRMEVYSAIYDKDNNTIRKINADIVNENTYNKFLNEKIVFFGDGANKCKTIIKSKNAIFLDNVLPTSKDIGELSYAKFLKKDFEDVAYFEPYYLKPFMLGKKS